jgi:branched-subunit amino acid ABC-type transport system permease component
MGSQRVAVVALVAIVSVDDAPVLLVPVVDVAVVLVVAVVSVVLVPVALAPVEETPVSTAAVSVLALLSFLQPTANAVTTSRTVANDLFMQQLLIMISGGEARKDERTALNERL